MPKIIIVSNRLPITIGRENNELIFKESSGGLVTGLSSMEGNPDCIWIGFPGISSDKINKDEKEYIKKTLIEKYKCYPVFLNSEEIKFYYNGFSNKTIWPLFHYFPYYTVYENKFWNFYIKVNNIFCDEIISIARAEDLIWVHDYHLMLLPELIRQKLPNIKIGFFLHIPFPSYEIFRLLPYRKQLIEGVLGADLIGFHTYSYVRHFLRSVMRICGYENYFGRITYKSRIVKVDVFPMGIDYNKFHNAVKDKKTLREKKILMKKIKKLKVILSIDRVDYTKGIVQRLEAYDYFLSKYPEYTGKIVLIMIAVPTRTKINSYLRLKNKVNQLVGNINGRYSTVSWSPIIYLYKSISFNSLIALYSISDIALLTPLRDGMNLIAKEFIACKNKKGVLILSEMAGVSEELGEAVVVNPNNKIEVSDFLKMSLNMPKKEQASRLTLMKERLKRNNVYKWADNFIEKLTNIEKNDSFYKTIKVADNIKKLILDNYLNSRKRLFLLDYDGTLVQFYENPDKAKPDDELYSILKKLVSNDKNRVVIVSSRDQKSLESWFGKTSVSLVAEHGAWVKENGNNWKTNVSFDDKWKKEIRGILELFVDRTPKTYIEEKDYSLVWHYRNADPEFAFMRLNEIKSELINIVANLNLGIIDGNKILEVKSLNIDKGKVAYSLMNKENYDFILSIGDDVTDEDMFKAVPDFGFTVKVGMINSNAKYWLNSYKEVRELLKLLGDS